MQKSLYVVSFLFFFILGYSQEQDRFSVALDHVALSVNDVNKSASFYKEVLQLKEITNRTQMEGIRWFSLGKDKELHLISIIKKPVSINKAVHFAIKVTHYSSFIKNLKKHKIQYSDWPGNVNKINIRADGVKQVFFKDPDGYWIEANSSL